MKNTICKVTMFLRTAISYLLAALVSIIFFIPCLVIAACLPARTRYTSKLLFWFLGMTCYGLIKSFFLTVRVSGLDRLPPAPAIIVANHASALDIPVLGMILAGRPHLWYALNRFFSTPILGFLLRRIAISVDQEHPIKAARALLQGVALCRQHHLYSVLFPEGGRYLDKEVHAFFSGFAMMARKLGQPVVPVLIRGLGKVYPPGSFLIHLHPIDVVIGDALIMNPQETDEEFSQRVRGWFISNS